MSGNLFSKVEKVLRERQDIYGNPENSFALIGAFWSAFLSAKKNTKIIINEDDVAVMMLLLKVARMVNQGNYDDNIIDAIGYLTILRERILKNEKE